MLKKIKKKINLLSNHAHIIIVSFVAFSLRILNLGYSDYQGDEIKSFFIIGENQTIAEFLLNQRKGPGQFIITLLTKQVNENYSNEFLTRILFAIAGSLAVIFFYKLVENTFNRKVAFYSSLFFATNGFLVALSRISQYQSFVILFMVLAVYMANLSVTNTKYKKKGLLMSFIFWALSILFHYDGVFIAPIMFYFLYLWFKENVNNFNKKDLYFKHFLVTLAISGLLLSLFYIPFILNVSQTTLAYWGGRISGEVSVKISSSKYLFTVYQPIYVVHFYTILFSLGLFYVFAPYMRKYLIKIGLVAHLPNYEFKRGITLFTLFWFFLPLIFFEGLVYIPGTHIYNYLIPMFIFLSLGIVFIENVLKKFSRFFIPSAISYSGLIVLFAFLFLQSYAIFVNHDREYPWESEEFLIWEFPKPTPIYHLSMFGFPYYRNWEGIRDVIMASDNNGYYSTNERKSLARFYVPFNKSTDEAGHFIHIINPQSFTNKIQQEKALYWSERYPPVFTFSRSGKDLVRVYQMEPGTMEEILEKGY